MTSPKARLVYFIGGKKVDIPADGDFCYQRVTVVTTFWMFLIMCVLNKFGKLYYRSSNLQNSEGQLETEADFDSIKKKHFLKMWTTHKRKKLIIFPLLEIFQQKPNSVEILYIGFLLWVRWLD